MLFRSRPFWAIVTASAIKLLPKKVGIGVILVFVAINLYQFSRVENHYGLKSKKELVKWANQYLAGSNWELQSESKCHRENGLRYLFELSGNSPGRSFMDPNFSWLYPQPPNQVAAEKVLLVTDRPLVGSEVIIARKNFGAMNAYILKP